MLALALSGMATIAYVSGTKRKYVNCVDYHYHLLENRLNVNPDLKDQRMIDDIYTANIEAKEFG